MISVTRVKKAAASTAAASRFGTTSVPPSSLLRPDLWKNPRQVRAPVARSRDLGWASSPRPARWVAPWSATAPSAAFGKSSASSSSACRPATTCCWSRGIRSTGSNTGSSNKNSSTPAAVFSRLSRDCSRAQVPSLPSRLVGYVFDFAAAARVARPDRSLSAHALAGAPGGFWPRLWLPVFSHLLALCGGSSRDAWRAARCMAGLGAPLEVHPAAPGRQRSRPAPTRLPASRVCARGPRLIFSTTPNPFCNG